MAAGILAINLSSQAADEPLTGRQIMVMVDESAPTVTTGRPS